MEYRQAFRDYVVNGTPIPAEYRQEHTSTEDTGAAIPVTCDERCDQHRSQDMGTFVNRFRKLS